MKHKRCVNALKDVLEGIQLELKINGETTDRQPVIV